MADNEKTQDQPVDGPKIVAEILNRMRPENKERIIHAIQQKHPTIATKIEEKLYNFDDITELTPQGVQALISSVEHRDVVISLKTASDKARGVIYQNMSAGKRELTKSEFESLPQMRLTDVEEAQRRILRKLDELRTAGAVRTQGKHDVWV